MQVAVASVGAAVAAAHGLVGSEAGHRTLLRCVPNGMRSWVSLHGRCHRFPRCPSGRRVWRARAACSPCHCQIAEAESLSPVGPQRSGGGA
jgi:hypothetical protein